MNRRKIEDVELHIGHALERFLCGLKCSTYYCAICLAGSAFASWEEFIPSAYQRTSGFSVNGIERGLRSKGAILAERLNIEMPDTYGSWAKFCLVAISAGPIFAHTHTIDFYALWVNQHRFDN